MSERLNAKAKSTCRLKDDAEVGRLVLGERLFIIALAPERPSQSMNREICHFTVAGRRLLVFETNNRHYLNGNQAADDVARRLTGRELEIAVLVAQGCPNKNIAYRLQISEWTVSTYLRRIFAKLDVDSRAAMVYRCAPLIDRVADVYVSAE
jgi:DNA-binding CsgD family transcriptional regulator